MQACSVAQSCPTLFKPTDCSPSGSSAHGILQARRVGCLSLLQGIFLTQGSNPSCLHCRGIPYHLSTREDMGLIKNITLETLQITLYYSLPPVSNPTYPSFPTLIQSGAAQTPFPPTHTLQCISAGSLKNWCKIQGKEWSSIRKIQTLNFLVTSATLMKRWNTVNDYYLTSRWNNGLKMHWAAFPKMYQISPVYYSPKSQTWLSD